MTTAPPPLVYHTTSLNTNPQPIQNSRLGAALVRGVAHRLLLAAERFEFVHASADKVSRCVPYLRVVFWFVCVCLYIYT